MGIQPRDARDASQRPHREPRAHPPLRLSSCLPQEGEAGEAALARAAVAHLGLSSALLLWP